MKKRLVLILVAVLAVTASLAAYYRTAGGDAAPEYTTAPVTRGDVVETVEATGTLQAVTTVQVGTQVSGTIQSLHADFNSQVRKGQVIARLDPSLLQAQVDQAAATIVRLQADVERSQVALEDAEVKLRRAHQLLTAQLIPAIDVENAQATVQSGAGVGQVRAGAGDAGDGLAQPEPRQPQSLDHHRAGRRHRHLAQRRRRPDGGGEHVGADVVRARKGPHGDAGQRQHRRSRHRPYQAGPDCHVSRRRVSARRFTARFRRCASSRRWRRTSSAT